MEPNIETLLCEDCRTIFVQALEVERTQLAAQVAKDKLRALSAAKQQHGTKPPSKTQKAAPAAKPLKGRGGGTWKEVPVDEVLRNIRGDIAPGELSAQLGIATPVLRRRVQDIIGVPDNGTRWERGVGYLINGKPAWNHERDALRVDKRKGAVGKTGAVKASAVKDSGTSKSKPKSTGGRKPTPGPSDDEIRAYLAGKLTVDKLMRRYKCGDSKIYRTINAFKVRFGADAPHGEPKQVSNGIKSVSNGLEMSH